MKKSYSGLYIPVVTPFMDGGAIDIGAFKAMLECCLKKGNVDGFVVAGSTGENCTLSHEEHKRIIEAAVDQVQNKAKVIAGTGSNSTQEACELTEFAHKAGADACLVVSPYYNRPSQAGLYDYFRTVAEAADIDILIYNIPSRTACNVDLDTVARLAQIPNIKGIKEGAGDIQQMIELCYRFAETDFAVLTGEDTLFYTCLALGGDGGITAASNVAHSELKNIMKAVQENRFGDAAREEARIRPLVKALFSEINPVPCKYAAAKVFGFSGELRSPLLQATRQTQALLDEEMKRLQLKSW